MLVVLLVRVVEQGMQAALQLACITESKGKGLPTFARPARVSRPKIGPLATVFKQALSSTAWNISPLRGFNGFQSGSLI